MPKAVDPPGTIQIKNPRIIQLVMEEQEHGTGRSPTESAENLISEAVEKRRVSRAIRPAAEPAAVAS